jgi:hypothetical protein
MMAYIPETFVFNIQICFLLDLELKSTVMEIWLKLSILLCVFGFVKEFRPSEPFIIPYLTGEWKNFTDQVVSYYRLVE